MMFTETDEGIRDRTCFDAMGRDSLTEAEALEMEQEARDAIQEVLIKGEDPEEVLMALCGLEPDYILELLEY